MTRDASVDARLVADPDPSSTVYGVIAARTASEVEDVAGATVAVWLVIESLLVVLGASSL